MQLVTLRQMAARLKEGGGRLVGFDVGTRNVGVAVSDHLCTVASPHRSKRSWKQVVCRELGSGGPVTEVNSIIFHRNHSKNLQNIDNLADLVRSYSVAGFVIGYPLEQGGQKTHQDRMVKSFVSELELSGEFQDLCYLYWDERLTSAAVAAMLASLNIGFPHCRNLKDKMAAVSILQAWFYFEKSASPILWSTFGLLGYFITTWIGCMRGLIDSIFAITANFQLVYTRSTKS